MREDGSGTRKTAWLQPYSYPAKLRFSASHTYQDKQRSQISWSVGPKKQVSLAWLQAQLTVFGKPHLPTQTKVTNSTHISISAQTCPHTTPLTKQQTHIKLILNRQKVWSNTIGNKNTHIKVTNLPGIEDVFSIAFFFKIHKLFQIHNLMKKPHKNQ